MTQLRIKPLQKQGEEESKWTAPGKTPNRGDYRGAGPLGWT